MTPEKASYNQCWPKFSPSFQTSFQNYHPSKNNKSPKPLKRKPSDKFPSFQKSFSKNSSFQPAETSVVIGLVASFQDSNFSPSIYMEGYKYPPMYGDGGISCCSSREKIKFIRKRWL
jgi:hypothetical protein